MPVLALTRNGRPLARLNLAETEEIGEEAAAVSVNELQLCGFVVEDREPDTEYRLWVGDREAQPVAVAAPPALGRARRLRRTARASGQ